jgi:predicted glutamine amidotransferase
LARFLGQQAIETRNMLAHIRYATSGSVDLANVHPFSREMWGIQWCFCHNGQVPLMDDNPSHWLGNDKTNGEPIYFPIGSTDSEALFCALLNALRAEFTDTMPSLPVLFESLQKLCQEVVDYDRQGTILNFLLTCGPHCQWVYSWPGKRHGSKIWNGLHYTVRGTSTHLRDKDYSIAILGGSEDRVCIVATKPLTDDEEWIELKPGELILMDDGLPHVSISDLFRVELHGHGLNNEGKTLRPPALEEDMRRYKFTPSFFVANGI